MLLFLKDNKINDIDRIDRLDKLSEIAKHEENNFDTLSMSSNNAVSMLTSPSKLKRPSDLLHVNIKVTKPKLEKSQSVKHAFASQFKGEIIASNSKTKLKLFKQSS